MEKIILNLKARALKSSGLELDHRFKKWVKFVDSVDKSQSDGYAFVGKFVDEGTIEIEARPRVLLVAAESGSMKYHHCYYRVCVMDKEGNVTPTEIVESNKVKGWALRIRAKVAELVESLSTDEESAAS